VKNNQRRYGWLIAGLIVLAILILAGCGPGEEAPTETPVTEPAETGTPAAPTQAPPDGPPRQEAPILMQLSTEDGTLPLPGSALEQTASQVFDIDGDGVMDIVLGSREGEPSVVWFRPVEDGWERYVIDGEALAIEAGGAYHDIDGDGDLDLVFGGDFSSTRIWWWENPAPDFDPNTPWTRRFIKRGDDRQHHDLLFADTDHDGDAEFIFWNQYDDKLMLAEIPADPLDADTWLYTPIFEGTGEGLDFADIDGDGLGDLLAGGYWFKYNGLDYDAHAVDISQDQTRIAAGDLLIGGLPEIVIVPGDGVGPAYWYTCDGDPTEQSCWQATPLLDVDVDHGHSLQIVDFNLDGYLDIFLAEMRLNGGNDDAGMWLFLGDGEGGFTRIDMAIGIGNHESRVADLDGDGDYDILGKPFNWDTPRLDIWLTEGFVDGYEPPPIPPTDTPAEVPDTDATPADEPDPTDEPDPPGDSTLDQWGRVVVDADRPWRAVFVQPADLNGDGWADIATGGYWYANPGDSGGAWTRQTFGDPLNNLAILHDFDGDGDLDALGTTGKVESAVLVWASNDGSGAFTVYDNVPEARGDFLQGVAIVPLADEVTGVALSWHNGGSGVQMLRVPADPTAEPWDWATISDDSQYEALSLGDIDGDGDPDLLLGTRWLRNEGDGWTAFTLFEPEGEPDRNRLADLNGDGQLDAVVGYEAVNERGVLGWYTPGDDPTALWTETVIDRIVGPMSVDVADMDGDGDLDVVVGEHNLSRPEAATAYVYENADGAGTDWIKHEVYTGDEHHDGTQVADMNNDGLLDIVSIGWENPAVVVYLQGEEASAPDATAAPAPTAVPADTDTPAPTDEPTSEPVEVTVGVQVAYTFDEGSGTTVIDAGGLHGLDLTISDPDAVTWGDGFLSIRESAVIQSAGPATGLNAAIQATGEVTIAAWLQPANVTQDGPARIVSLSRDSSNRNLTLAQGLWDDQPADVFNVRLRTTETDSNGLPDVRTGSGTATTDLTHVVYTRDQAGAVRIYINGAEAVSATVGGDLSGWSAAYPLVLANESSGDRPWLGDLYAMTVRNDALSADAVAALYEAGAE
jgi:hypothetical protein